MSGRSRREMFPIDLDNICPSTIIEVDAGRFGEMQDAAGTDCM
jgi:hypothetical protein